MEKLKIGVFGTGHLGKLHIKMLKQIDACKIIGIAGCVKSGLERPRVACRTSAGSRSR